jgi:hypothetical protein
VKTLSTPLAFKQVLSFSFSLFFSLYLNFFLVNKNLKSWMSKMDDTENIPPAFKRLRKHPNDILVINSSPREEAQRIHDFFMSELDSKPDMQEELDYSNLSNDYKKGSL